MDEYNRRFIIAKYDEGLSVKEISRQVPYSSISVASTIASHNTLREIKGQIDGVYASGEIINEPLLTIELQDETSVPKVFYKGEEIKLKTNVFFDWDTDTDVYGGLTYAIEHYDRGKVPAVLNRIERRVKGHATN